MKSNKVIEINPLDLLTNNRFDLLAKLLYLRFKENGLNTGFGKDVYIEHLKVMNGLYENDCSQKLGAEEFINSFDETYNSIKLDGFKPQNAVPIGSNGSILDGAHRTASAIYLNKPVVTKIEDAKEHLFDYKFFKQRGLNDCFLDAMALEYLRYKENVFLAIIWPTAGSKFDGELEEMLGSNANVLYKKEIALSKSGAVMLVKEAYAGESWLGSYDDQFQGAQNKASWCFAKDGPVKAYLFESTANLIQLKERIRAVYGSGKHSIHVTDNKKETIDLSNILFNYNSIHMLNNAYFASFKWLEKLKKTYRTQLEKLEVRNDEFLIVGSYVMGIYGLREPTDLDFIHLQKLELGFGTSLISDDTGKLEYLEMSDSELILDPNFHLYADGLKVITIKVLESYKRNRLSDKDVLDLKLIQNIGENKRIKHSFKELFRLFITLSFLKGRVKFYILKLRFYYLKLKALSL